MIECSDCGETFEESKTEEFVIDGEPICEDCFYDSEQD